MLYVTIESIEHKGIVFSVGGFKQVFFILKPHNESKSDTLLIRLGKLSFCWLPSNGRSQ